MTYLLNRKGNFYYNRRVPELYCDLDNRVMVRVALGTKCPRTAWRKAVLLNDHVEAYWQELASSQQPHDNRAFRKTVRIARLIGFTYQPMAAVVRMPVADIADRVMALKGASPRQIEAVLGIRDEPELPLKSVLDRFWELSKDKTLNKTPDQVRKWRNPRIRVMKAFIRLVGNKELAAVCRDDILAYRDWWLGRIEQESKTPDSANKEIVILKGVLELVSDHYKAGLDISHLFKKIKLKTRFKQKRLPFTSQQIRSMLESPKLGQLNEQAKWFLFAAAGTGARPSEIVGLQPEDIRAYDPVPHISITDRKERTLKNVHSQRVLPLTGYALEAFRACPNGFPRYRDKPDNLSNTINKFLRENKLLPSAQHSVYSLRHSFQDRILSVAAPDRIQAELMGHRFQRPKYGDGGTLELKMEWMEKVCLKSCTI